jgi:hypothetical protein
LRHKVRSPDERVSAATGLETKNRTEGNAPTVVRAMVEIIFIDYVKAQADRSKMALQAAAAIENSDHVIGAHAVDATKESSQSGGVPSIRKSDAPLRVTKGCMAWWPMFTPGPNFSVENTQIRA